MSKKVLNLGTPPGNLGDGDSLRDAFSKVQDNFDELYNEYHVNDTSLEHSDPNIDGTIASVLVTAGANGGGVVVLAPGIYNITETHLIIPGNVILRGTSKTSSGINLVKSGIGISLENEHSGIESLSISLPFNLVISAIKSSVNFLHIKDVFFTGGNASSWGIDIDPSNVCVIENITMGGNAHPLFNAAYKANGIIYQISNWQENPYNFGDSMLSMIDIRLGSPNTTGIKFSGPNDTRHKINNVLLIKIAIVGSGRYSNSTGIHINNSSRIVLNTVDLENLSTGIVESSTGNGTNSCSNNVYMSVFVLGSSNSYESSGVVSKRTFIGCDNVTVDDIADSDTILPNNVWLDNGNVRISNNSGYLQIDNGSIDSGIQIQFDSTNPEIRPSTDSDTSQVYIGQQNTRGVECTPGMILPRQYTIPNSPKDGMIIFFGTNIVGSNEGLYQYRYGTWTFIG